MEPWLRARIAEALVEEGCPPDAAASLASEAYVEDGFRGALMLRLWRCGVTVTWPMTEEGATSAVAELATNVADHNEEQHDQRKAGGPGAPVWDLREDRR